MIYCRSIILLLKLFQIFNWQKYAFPNVGSKNWIFLSDFLLGVVHNWRHAFLNYYFPLPSSSSVLLLRRLYYRYKIRNTLPLRPRRHLWTIPYGCSSCSFIIVTSQLTNAHMCINFFNQQNESNIDYPRDNKVQNGSSFSAFKDRAKDLNFHSTHCWSMIT